MAPLEQNQKTGEKVAKDDGELGVLSLIVGAFETLDEKEVSRALKYLGDRYKPPVTNGRPVAYISGTSISPATLPPPSNIC